MIEERIFQHGTNLSRKGYIFYNDGVAYDIVSSVTDMVHPGEIILAFHYKDEIVLLHSGQYAGIEGPVSAGKQLLRALEIRNIHCFKNDLRIQQMLKEPNFCSRKVLIDFLKAEISKLENKH